MEAKHTPDQEFNNSLSQLGNLYEEEKDCLFRITILKDEEKDYQRLFEIFREIRDNSAITLKENQKLKETNRELLEALGMIIKAFPEDALSDQLNDDFNFILAVYGKYKAKGGE